MEFISYLNVDELKWNHWIRRKWGKCHEEQNADLRLAWWHKRATARVLKRSQSGSILARAVAHDSAAEEKLAGQLELLTPSPNVSRHLSPIESSGETATSEESSTLAWLNQIAGSYSQTLLPRKRLGVSKWEGEVVITRYNNSLWLEFCVCLQSAQHGNHCAIISVWWCVQI